MSYFRDFLAKCFDFTGKPADLFFKSLPLWLCAHTFYKKCLLTLILHLL